MFKAIIVDDEPKLREVLKIKINRNFSSLTILGEAENILEAEQLIQKEKPDILFLDIAMPGGTGFDLINKFDTIDFEIVFVTGFQEYALDALKISAVDYLLKPIKTDELISAINKAIKRIKNKEAFSDFAVLKHNINVIGDQTAKIAIPNNDAIDFVIVSEIIRCEGWNKYTRIKLKDDKEIISSYNIGVFKDLLEKYGFYSCHKSHVINKSHIRRYLKEGTIIMSDNSHVPVARRKKEEFLNEVLVNKIEH